MVFAAGHPEIFGSHGSESHAGSGGAYITTDTLEYYGVSRLLVSATTRQEEVALRASLGASLGRLTQQFLVEALVLAAASCILGCLIAYGSLPWLVALIPAHRIDRKSVV